MKHPRASVCRNMRDGLTRRGFVTRGLLAAACTLPFVALLRSGSVFADDETRKSFHYQDYPNGDLRCAKCVFFVAPASGSTAGVCRIIDGDVLATGWCRAFRPG